MGLVLLILVGLIIASSIIIFDRSISFHASDKQQQYKHANAAIADLLLEPVLNTNIFGYKKE
ncbi:hypothetical protein [Nitrosomonas sp. Nm34]|uniref:hypothetical protein n=1 Tax=Nitrosomonas sp. Nm34 TaxID=1881055 RepID=UPI000B82EE4D|nr:hypothetical protein [Nitrosomonas sp. Nm34]